MSLHLRPAVCTELKLEYNQDAPKLSAYSQTILEIRSAIINLIKDRNRN